MDQIRLDQIGSDQIRLDWTRSDQFGPSGRFWPACVPPVAEWIHSRYQTVLSVGGSGRWWGFGSLWVKLTKGVQILGTGSGSNRALKPYHRFRLVFDLWPRPQLLSPPFRQLFLPAHQEVKVSKQKQNHSVKVLLKPGPSVDGGCSSVQSDPAELNPSLTSQH